MWSNTRSRCEKFQALLRQELLRLKDFETMIVYTHVLDRFQKAVAGESGRIIRAHRSA